VASDVVAEELPGAARSTLRRRRRRFRPGDPEAVALIPDGWRELLLAFARRAPRARFATLLADAGSARVESAYALCDWLLAAGWITTTESFERGRWVVQWIEFRDVSALRASLGLHDPERTLHAWQALAVQRYDDERVARLHASLSDAPPRTALRRHRLLVALDAWLADQRFGTRRDFALHARGSTKAVTDAEWAWLASGVDLEAAGITKHAMTIELRAPLVLVTPDGRIDLGASADFMSITAATVGAALRMEGDIGAWRVVENRTSFERVARRCGRRDAVVWVPGYPPSAWRQALSRLVGFTPVSAEIACDPDPDGIRIALCVGEVFAGRDCAWSPWRMDAATIDVLPVRRRLTARDRTHLDTLLAGALPPGLDARAQWMREHGEKAEQEAYL
jgi:hypothetical protein